MFTGIALLHFNSSYQNVEVNEKKTVPAQLFRKTTTRGSWNIFFSENLCLKKCFQKLYVKNSLQKTDTAAITNHSREVDNDLSIDCGAGCPPYEIIYTLECKKF